MSKLLTLKEEYEQVIKQFPQWSARQFADYFEISVSGFYSALYRYGLKMPCASKRHPGPRVKGMILGKPEVELIAFAKEHTLSEIADYTGKDVRNIGNILNAKGISYKRTFSKEPFVNKKLNHYGDEKDMILELLKLNKFTDASIARVFGYSKTAIRKMRIKHDY